MKGHILAKFAGFVLLFCSIASMAQDKQYRFEISKIPDWVSQVELVPAKAESADGGQHYLLSNTQVKIDGKSQHKFSQFRFALEDYSAIESSSDIRITFDPAYQKIHFHHVNIVRNGKTIEQLKREKLKFISREDDQNNNIYGGQVDAVLLLEDVRIGDVIDYSYTIEGTNPVFDGNFSSFYTLGYGVPVDNIFVRVLSDKSQPLYRKVGNIEDGFVEKDLGNMVEYSMHVKYAEATQGESDTPDWFDPYPWVHFSQYQDWQSVYQWAGKLFEIDGELDAELNGFIESLKPLSKTEKISKATQFIQDDIRYLGLELGENSHRPHHPNETFTNRYGDCKDKSLLLATVLNKLGVEAWPALVSTDNLEHLDMYLPAHNVFNHAIVKVVHEGQDIWLDPTISYQGQSLTSIHQPTYGKALLIKPGTVALTEAKPSQPATRAIEVDELWQAADYTSPVIRTITTTYRGREAESLRYQLSSRSAKNVQRSYLNYYAKSYPKIRPLNTLTIEDDKERNVLVIKEKYLVPGYWKMGENRANFELYTDYVATYINLPKTIVREHPLAIPSVDSVQHRVTLSLPEDIDFSEDVGVEVIENDYFKFETRFEYDHRRISYTSRFSPKQKVVMAKDTAEHITLLKKARTKLDYRSSIVNFEDDPGFDQMKVLIKTLSEQVQQSAN